MPTPPVLLTASFQHELRRQEDWDPHTTLYQPYEVEQILMPDCAKCLSVRVYLQMLQLPFSIQYRTNAEFMSPSGNVPFIKCGQFVVAELEPIIEFVHSKGHSLSSKLEPSQQRNMRVFMSMVDSMLGNAESWVVWCDPDTIPISNQRCGYMYPFPLNYWMAFMKKRYTKQRLSALGWLKKTPDEVYSEIEECCKALSNRLGNSQYFFDEPTELDALVFGHIFTILTTVLPTNRFAAVVRGYSNLVDHCSRIEKLYFNFSKDSIHKIDQKT